MKRFSIHFLYRTTIKTCLFLIVLLAASRAHAGFLIRPPVYLGLTSGLVGSWSFEQADMAGTTAYDRSGQGNNGTLTNGPQRTIGKIGQGLQFDGVNDYVDVGDIATRAVFSLSAWVRFTGFNNFPIIVSKYNDGSGVNNEFFFGLNTNGLGTKLRLKVNDNINGGAITADYSGALSLNVWYHVAATYSGGTTGASSIRVYLNGVRVDDTNADSGTFVSIQNTTESFRIGAGRSSNSLTYFFPGNIDEVRVYNRALSPDEIKRLYNIGGTLHVGASQNAKLTTGLVGLWSFDQADSAGTTAYDRSGNSNNGTLTNGPQRTIGKIGQGLQFDGVDDYVDTNSSSIVDAQQSISIAAWVYFTGNGNYPAVMVKSSAFIEVTAKYAAYFGVGTRQMKFSSGGTVGAQSATTIPLNTWTYVVYTQDSGSLKYYINGVLNKTQTALPAPTTSTDTWKIGTWTLSGSSGKFPGSIDDVRIYNRALSPDEIKRLYNIGGTLHIGASQNAKLTTGLVGLWSFDQTDSAGTTAYDRSGNSNNGTLTNGPQRTIGKIGQGLQFDGVNDYVDAGNPATLSFERTNPFSISGWFNSNSAGSIQMMVAKRINSGTFRGYSISFRGDLGTYEVVISNTTGTNEIIVRGGTTGTGWKHVGFTYDGLSAAAGVKIYVNGVLQTPTIVTNSLSATIVNSVNGDIGIREGAGFPFSGSIDEVRIYNRVLTKEEITRLYQIGR